MSKDIVVVGGGIIGCSIALRLAEEGLSVALVERGRIGSEASRAAAGMLSPQADAVSRNEFFDLCLRSLSIYREYADHLQEASGIDPEYQDSGTLCVALDENERREMERRSGWQREAALKVSAVTPDDIAGLEPGVTDRAAGGVFIPGDHQVENRRLMEALAVAARRAGVQVIEGEEVLEIATDRGKAAGVKTATRNLRSSSVIIAAGCWSGGVAAKTGLTLPVVPARGQMLALKGQDLPISHVVHSRGCYLVPRLDGRIVVGSTVEYVEYRKGVTAGGIHWLLDAAIKLVPALRQWELIETWSGLRPDTPDHMPIMGTCSIDNLILATGHFRSGILLAPITARLIAQTVMKGKAPDELAPFSIERFD
jgi:glycine oxidase